MRTDYAKYLNDIHFLIKPMDEVPEGKHPVFDEDLLPVTWNADVYNTVLPVDDVVKKIIFAGIFDMPRMSSYAIGALINLIVSEMPDDETYINVGVWHGFTFFCGLIGNPEKKCVGVDDFSEFRMNNPKERFYEKFEVLKSDNHRFFDMECKAYLSTCHEKIGFYFYDALHTKNGLCEGLQLAEPHFSEDCLILIDDINMLTVRQGLDKFLELAKYKYNVIFEQETSWGCHPSFWNGVILLKRGAK